jgi:hypothetical protein
MIAVDQNSLTKAASQYAGITGDMKEWVKIFLLAQVAGAPYASMTGAQLIAAVPATYQAISNQTLAKQVEIALLGVIANEV